MRYLILLTLLPGCADFMNTMLNDCLNQCSIAYERNALYNSMSPTIRADDEACRNACNTHYKGQQ